MVCDARFFRYFKGGGEAEGSRRGVSEDMVLFCFSQALQLFYGGVGFQKIWFCFGFPRLFMYFIGGG